MSTNAKKCLVVNKKRLSFVKMQRVSRPVYTYDATGKLTNYTPSGGSNDVIAEHVLLDPRIPGPRSLVAGGLRPTVLNTPKLFTPPLSLTSPPVERPTTVGTTLGYANMEPEMTDLYGISKAKPLITMNRQINNLAENSTVISGDTTKNTYPDYRM